MLKRKSNWIVVAILLTIIGFFFYPTFIKGFIPFPGDLLLAEYQPWRSYSFEGIAPGGVPNKAQYFDTLRQLYPWKTFAIETVKSGELPLWNPHNFSGSPLFANFQSALLYPLNIFYLFLPQTIGWTILIISQPLLALFFMYLLSRKFSLSKKASLFASISYAFSLYMTTFLEYNIMGHFMYLLPLSILAIEYILEKKKYGYPLLAVIIALSLFAGHLQLFSGILGYTLTYAILRIYREHHLSKVYFKKILWVALFIVIGIGISGIQLIPGLELLKNSARTSHSVDFFLKSALILPSQLVLYLIPDLFGNPAVKNYLLPFSYPSKALYIGLAPILLATIGTSILKKNRQIMSIAISSLIVASIVFLTPVSFVIYHLNLPIISSSSPSNFIFLVSFGLSILAGAGIDSITKISFKKSFVFLGISWILFALIFVTLLVMKIPFTKNNFIFSMGILFVICVSILVSTLRKNLSKIGLLIIIFVTILDLFYFFHKFNPFVPASYIYPPTEISARLNQYGIDRSWGYSYAGIASNFSTQLGIYSPEGYDPLYPKTYASLMQSATDGKLSSIFTDSTRSDAIIPNGFGQTNIMDNFFRMKILQITGTKYIVDKVENGSTDETFPYDSFEKIATANDFSVLRYKKSLPRYFMANSYIVYNNDQQFSDIFYSPSFNPAQTILLSENPGVKNLSSGSAMLTNYSPSEISIKTSAESNSLLFLSDSYYPGWKAYIDGEETKIFKANYAFRAIVVPKGTHTVEFLYQPKSVHYGLILTIVSIITCIIVFPYARKKS